MRPLRLELDGFAAFREAVSVDLADVELVALVGPTGSGKSTLIDAVTFALYGSVPRYGDVRLVAPVINQLSTEARVRLDFEVAGRRYTAVRVVRRTRNGASTREARLEQGEEVLAGSAREMGPVVERVVGLTFEQFCRTVVLPQGEFARFLHDDPARRQDLLVRLLDLGTYETMAARARRRAAAAAERVALLDEQLANGADLTAAGLTELRRRASRLAEARTTAEDTHRALAAVTAELDELAADHGRLVEQVQVLAGVVVPPGAEELATDLAGAEQRLAAADAARHAARAEVDRCRELADAMPEPVRLESLVEARNREAEVHDERAAAERELAEASAALDARVNDAERARATQDRAEEELRRARTGADAASWVSVLAVGEPCPVCRQTVAELPAHDVAGELSAAEAAATEARRAADEAASARSAAERTRLAAETRLEGTIAELARIDTMVRDAPALAELERLLDDARRARAAATTASRALDAADDELGASQRALDELRRREAELARSHTAMRDGVLSCGLAPPAPAGGELVDDWRRLAAWALAVGRDVNDRVAQQERARSEAEERRQQVLATLDRIAASVAFDGPAEGLAPAIAELAAAAQADAAAYEARLALADEQRAARRAVAERHAVADELGRLLGARGFERWLLAEALEDLAARATERLTQLSGGQYSLVVDADQFRVRDHRNADELRDARTLSGGETFLASLALALALADSVAELAGVGAPPLESVFLDEGFGTLDPETLDVVASALEELGASGRMVAVVTHIRELADRLPVRLEVRRGPVTSTVRRVEQ